MMSSKPKSEEESPRGRHLQVRADAYASALYYGECSLQGISSDGATAAEQKARSCQSKWWLPGYDPEHPSQTYGSAPTPMGGNNSPASVISTTSLRAYDILQVSEAPQNNDNDAETNNNEDNNPSGNNVQGNEGEEDFDENEIPFELAESTGPVFARDDDLGSAFGTMNNLYSQNIIPANPLPSWLVGRHGALNSSSTHENHSHVVYNGIENNFRAENIGSSGEVLQTFASCTNDFRSGQKRDLNQVTSESEADDSGFHSSTASCDGSSVGGGACYRQRILKPLPISLPVQEHLERRARKRVRILLDNEKEFEDSALQQSSYLDAINAQIKYIKSDLLSTLETDERGTKSPFFASALASLQSMYRAKLKMTATQNNDANPSADPQSDCSTTTAQYTKNESVDGTWVSISHPTYQSRLGTNSEGEKLFSLGRMSFDIYKPSDLICSIQKQYNTIRSVGEEEELPPYVPEYLRKEADGSGRLKTHNIIAAFTIEHPDNIDEDITKEQSVIKKPLRGIMTNYGYTLSDPFISDRKSIWFTGGTIEPADDDEESMEEWKKLFAAHSVDNNTVEDESSLKDGDDNDDDDESGAKRIQNNAEAETARDLASKILLGAVSEPMLEDGTIGFHLIKPIGGHGHAYCDILYLDDEIRVMRGHSGSVYVFRREVIGD